LMTRIEDARPHRIALDIAEKTAALHAFAHAFLPAYDEAKTNAGVLDFDDLIEKTAALLSSRTLQWVLYRLDGRIEHILVDEAQDTSPPQWEVINALSEDILAGDGTRTDRSIFIVGDKKQSIYSFQGADAAVFDRLEEKFTSTPANRASVVARELQYSFRSSTAILSAVDHVFEGDAGRGLGFGFQHRAFHETKPGRVDIWPLVPAPDKIDEPEWYDPVDRLASNDPRITLADHIAGAISNLIENETIPGINGAPRPIHPGDILILVQSRGPLFDHIIRACKARNIPMAGADRLKIGAELAVRDVLALLSFLALPEDDLSLATALRSPLFGWSEQDLYALAEGRVQPYLWAELRTQEDLHPKTLECLNDLRSNTDFLRPYELIDRILTKHNGLKNLLARLGPEAKDGIEELLNQALAFETTEVPSLTAFLTYAQSEEVDIKRQIDASGRMVRIMTVHGAKGLESPIVILPDTTRSSKSRNDTVLLTEKGSVVWRSAREECPDSLHSSLDAAADAEREERQRLLYVAMTRAESWLIVCGAETRASRSHWHSNLEIGLSKMRPEVLDTPTGEGMRVSHGAWPSGKCAMDNEDEHRKLVSIPDFFYKNAPPNPHEAPDISPSKLGEGLSSAGYRDRTSEAARKHGDRIHRLLEHLPATSRSLEDTTRILATIEPVEAAALHQEANACLDAHPEIFTPDALTEVDISANMPSFERKVVGTIDRLIIAKEKVLLVDYKSNTVVPDRAEGTPEGILRQMGAYLAALEQIYPDRKIELAVLWTKTAKLMRLPHALVSDAFHRATIS